MVNSSVTVLTECNDMLRMIGAAISNSMDVMGLQVRAAVLALQKGWGTAAFTGSIGSP